MMTVAGCVQRKITITSNPPGALVIMNDREVGRTPVTTDFLWYGDYEFIVRKDGFETLDKRRKIRAPWWQFVPFDFFAEISPTRPVDAHALNFDLIPRRDDDSPGELVARGLELQKRLPETRPTSSPATQPATTRGAP